MKDEPGVVPIEDLRQEHFTPKWFLNGFPKSGIHWLALMMYPLARPQFTEHELWGQPWAGTFRLNSWSTLMVPLERVTYKIGRLQDERFIKSHSAYVEALERFLWYLGVCTIFIYRDPRDVAVSQAFHVLSDTDEMSHPDKAFYKAMDDFGAVLKAVIVGAEHDGIRYPGVMERWEYYAPWLDVPWVYKVRFEELKADAHQVAINIIQYGFERVSGIFGLQPTIITENIDTLAEMMVRFGQRTDQSPTFRKGAVGDWREHFTPEIEQLFMETDKDGWLERLGYA